MFLRKRVKYKSKIAALSFYPTDLIGSGNSGDFLDPNRLDLMTVGRDGTGGSPSDGSVVGRIIGAKEGRIFSAPSDAARPLLQKQSNGSYRLVFDGVNDTFNSTDITGFAGASTMTLAAASSFNSYAVFSCLFSVRRDTSGSEVLVFYPNNSNTNNGFDIFYNTALIKSMTTNLNNGLIHTFIYRQGSATDHEIFENNVSKAISSSSRIMSALINNMNFGSWHNSAQFFAGKSGGMFFINRNLSSSERSLLHNYLKNSYG